MWSELLLLDVLREMTFLWRVDRDQRRDVPVGALDCSCLACLSAGQVWQVFCSDLNFSLVSIQRKKWRQSWCQGLTSNQLQTDVYSATFPMTKPLNRV